jgi:hypothetical protein
MPPSVHEKENRENIQEWETCKCESESMSTYCWHTWIKTPDPGRSLLSLTFIHNNHCLSPRKQKNRSRSRQESNDSRKPCSPSQLHLGRQRVASHQACCSLNRTQSHSVEGDVKEPRKRQQSWKVRGSVSLAHFHEQQRENT